MGVVSKLKELMRKTYLSKQTKVRTSHYLLHTIGYHFFFFSAACTKQLYRTQHCLLPQPLISSSVSVIPCTLSPYALQNQNPSSLSMQHVSSFLNMKIYRTYQGLELGFHLHGSSRTRLFPSWYREPSWISPRHRADPGKH